MSKKKEVLASFEIKEPEEPKEISLFSQMMTLSHLPAGLKQLSHPLLPQIVSAEFQALLLSLQNFEGTGTFSVRLGPNIYTMSFFVKGDNLCLDISHQAELGQLELQNQTAPMKEKLISWKHVILLIELIFIFVLAVSMRHTKA